MQARDNVNPDSTHPGPALLVCAVGVCMKRSWNFKDRVGERYGRLTVVSYAGKTTSGVILWNCVCDCGNNATVRQNNLLSGGTKSCGCMSSRHTIAERTKKHGISDRHPIYVSWIGMKERCHNPNNPSYSYYGARGIYVCDEWIHDFLSFYNWSLENGFQKGLSIDRIDNDGPYAPWNCRWATIQQQNHNRRSNIYIEYNGERKIIADWAREMGIQIPTLRLRLLKGWSVEEALTIKPIVGNNQNLRKHHE